MGSVRETAVEWASQEASGGIEDPLLDMDGPMPSTTGRSNNHTAPLRVAATPHVDKSARSLEEDLANILPSQASNLSVQQDDEEDENPLLPADFRIQVKLLKGMHSQERMLQQLLEAQARVEADLQSIRSNMSREFTKLSNRADTNMRELQMDLRGCFNAPSPQHGQLPATNGLHVDSLALPGTRSRGMWKDGSTGSAVQHGLDDQWREQSGQSHGETPDAVGGMSDHCTDGVTDGSLSQGNLRGSDPSGLGQTSGLSMLEQRDRSNSHDNGYSQSSKSIHETKASFFGGPKFWRCEVCDETNKLVLDKCSFCSTSKPKPGLLQRIVQHWLFDVVSGLVILTNAVTIAIVSNFSIVWAIEHPGEGDVPEEAWESFFSWCFMVFYSVELALRIAVFGKKFFTCEDYKWNLFDFVLVIMVFYEKVIAVFVVNFVTLNVGWLRVLRLIKMLKIFRVVRLMRFFRVLRLMVSQIAGSFMMLFWSFLLLYLMIFLFALCFLHGMTEYLTDTPKEAIPDVIVTGIDDYWASMPKAMTSLYMAMASGADWEDIARPIRLTSWVYYCVFLFYIGFAFISVLNVVTGLYVDSAMKISEQDENSVQEATAEREEVAKLIKYYTHLDPHAKKINWHNFRNSLKTQEMQAFLTCLMLDLKDVKRVFRMLQNNGSVNIDEFVNACMKVRGDMKAIDLMSLLMETRRNSQQIGELFEYFDDKFLDLQRRGLCDNFSDDRAEHLRQSVSGAYNGAMMKVQAAGALSVQSPSQRNSGTSLDKKDSQRRFVYRSAMR